MHKRIEEQTTTSKQKKNLSNPFGQVRKHIPSLLPHKAGAKIVKDFKKSSIFATFFPDTHEIPKNHIVEPSHAARGVHHSTRAVVCVAIASQSAGFYR